MKKYYVKEKEGYIWDCLTYPYSDYVEIIIEEKLKSDILAGYYYLKDNKIIEDEGKKKEILSQREEAIKEKTILELIEWGLIK